MFVDFLKLRIHRYYRPRIFCQVENSQKSQKSYFLAKKEKDCFCLLFGNSVTLFTKIDEKAGKFYRQKNPTA